MVGIWRTLQIECGMPTENPSFQYWITFAWRAISSEPRKHQDKEDYCTTSNNIYYFEPPYQGDTPIATFCKRLQHRSPPLEMVRKEQWTQKPGHQGRRIHHCLLVGHLLACVTLWRHMRTLTIFLYISSSVCVLCHSCTWWGLFRPKPQSCSMKFEHLPSVNLVWHDLKLQHGSSNIVGIKEPFRLNVVCPLRIPLSSTPSSACFSVCTLLGNKKNVQMHVISDKSIYSQTHKRSRTSLLSAWSF